MRQKRTRLHETEVVWTKFSERTFYIENVLVLQCGCLFVLKVQYFPDFSIKKENTLIFSDFT